jgi:hypothetical protein
MGPPDHDSGRRLTQPTPATTPTATTTPKVTATIADSGATVAADLSPTPPRGPDEHHAAEQQLGLRRVDELLALSTNHDPYFKGSRAHWRDARWFAALLTARWSA